MSYSPLRQDFTCIAYRGIITDSEVNITQSTIYNRNSLFVRNHHHIPSFKYWIVALFCAVNVFVV